MSYPTTGVWFGHRTDAILLFSPLWALPVVMAIVNCHGADGCVI